MRQSVKETRSRIEPLLLPGNLYESLKLARAAAECATTIWALQDSDKGEQSRLPRD
ncbi:hypothetical protein QP794_22080 [Paenibacillus sp. UMB7766-LJ446]|jgi:hypothetical protein|uniref:Uncharacterized protein n=2 Tax=Paenibacillus TaxID=44249 RepID=A0ABX2MUX6_9BACL|nr:MULTISPECIES: hypothetical protein [Paenibacillus]MDK8192779.1 hypothetical protein [Paenibacillus sp. UMB7766-LJ446]MDN4604779.1 hypothetical protein [Paenibacillus vandeheii]MDN8588794.1 hypothetical protein [Paenibacillus sp. 11B]MDR9747659.1 hypothetical protein [Paenibacillus taichungensis]MEC0108857.1 hypothetical protein [Paenibacillus taichungensis]